MGYQEALFDGAEPQPPEFNGPFGKEDESERAEPGRERRKRKFEAGSRPSGRVFAGVQGHGQGFAPVTEALVWFLPPGFDSKWRTDAAQLHPGRQRTKRLRSPALPASLPSSPARPLPQSSACALESALPGWLRPRPTGPLTALAIPSSWRDRDLTALPLLNLPVFL